MAKAKAKSTGTATATEKEIVKNCRLSIVNFPLLVICQRSVVNCQQPTDNGIMVNLKYNFQSLFVICLLMIVKRQMSIDYYQKTNVNCQWSMVNGQ